MQQQSFVVLIALLIVGYVSCEQPIQQDSPRQPMQQGNGGYQPMQQGNGGYQPMQQGNGGYQPRQQGGDGGQGLIDPDHPPPVPSSVINSLHVPCSSNIPEQPDPSQQANNYPNPFTDLPPCNGSLLFPYIQKYQNMVYNCSAQIGPLQNQYNNLMQMLNQAHNDYLNCTKQLQNAVAAVVASPGTPNLGAVASQAINCRKIENTIAVSNTYPTLLAQKAYQLFYYQQLYYQSKINLINAICNNTDNATLLMLMVECQQHYLPYEVLVDYIPALNNAMQPYVVLINEGTTNAIETSTQIASGVRKSPSNIITTFKNNPSQCWDQMTRDLCAMLENCTVHSYDSDFNTTNGHEVNVHFTIYTSETDTALLITVGKLVVAATFGNSPNDWVVIVQFSKKRSGAVDLTSSITSNSTSPAPMNPTAPTPTTMNPTATTPTRMNPTMPTAPSSGVTVTLGYGVLLLLITFWVTM